jgi:hypothetical protein
VAGYVDVDEDEEPHGGFNQHTEPGRECILHAKKLGT